MLENVCRRRSTKLLGYTFGGLLCCLLVLYKLIFQGGYQYPAGQTRLHEQICKSTFHTSFRENLKKVLTYPHNPAILRTAGLLDGPSNTMETSLIQKMDIKYPKDIDLSKGGDYPDFPVIVTGSSANHFMESQGLLQSIDEKLSKTYKNIKIIYYDLGLRKGQRRLLEKYCHCEVRTFEFEKYPSDVKTMNHFIWKQIIIHTVLQQYPFVMWNDACVRYNTSDLNAILVNAKRYGIQVMSDDKRQTMVEASIAERTHIDTFSYLGEDPCLFDKYLETIGGWLLVTRSDFTLNAILRPWLLCGLTYGCMVTPTTDAIYYRCTDHGHFYGKCHRYDQSVLGIILTRLFNSDRNLLVVPQNAGINIARDDRVKYFPEQDYIWPLCLFIT